jgi:UDP-glucuronate decarboxylase
MLEAAVAQALRRDDHRIAITGAGGWIGLALLDLLNAALGPRDLRARVRAFGSDARDLLLADGSRFPQASLDTMQDLPSAPTFVFHTAFLTKDRAAHMAEAEYAAANRAITDRVLAALDPIGTTGVFVASSGAAAKVETGSAQGALHLYGQLKIEEEVRFGQWAEARGATAAIVRIFALLGPRINKPEAYAIASFILDALEGRPVEVRSPRQVIRAYASLRELMSLVLALLIQGGGVTSFDSGGVPLELGEVAREVAGLVPDGRVVRAPVTLPDADVYHGDSAAYERLLRAHGIAPVCLTTGIHETMDWLRRERASAIRAETPVQA